jgi:hypothetical protein
MVEPPLISSERSHDYIEIAGSNDGGVEPVNATVTPHESDRREETHAAGESAKTKPINCSEGSESSDRWGGSGRGDGNAT